MLDFTITINENIEHSRSFVKDNHYTHTFGRGGKYYFNLYLNDELVGVSIWRTPNGRLTHRLVNEESNSCMLDLTRFVLNNDMPKNSESWFLSRNIKWLKLNTDIKYLITYADTYENHKGIIYRATNWICFGKGGDSSRIYLENNGVKTLKSSRWIQHLKQRGEYDNYKDNIIKEKVNGKYRYLYPLRQKRKKYLNDNEELINNYNKQFTKLDLIN